jgi:hypothetical protein
MRSLSGEEQTSGLTAENVAFDPEPTLAAASRSCAKSSRGLRWVCGLWVKSLSFVPNSGFHGALPNKSGAMPGTS